MLLRRTKRSTARGQARAFSISAPIFPWPSSSTSTTTTTSASSPSAAGPSSHASTSNSPSSLAHSAVDRAVAVTLPLDAPTPSSSSSAPVIGAHSPLWSTLIDDSVPALSPSSALVIPTSRSSTHAPAATFKRRGERITRGSGFFTAQPTGFFSGLRSNRREFSTALLRRNVSANEAQAGKTPADPAHPLAGTELLSSWNDLIESAPPPNLLPPPNLGRLHRWEQPRISTKWSPAAGGRERGRPAATGWGREGGGGVDLTEKEKASFQDMFELLFAAMREEKEGRKRSEQSESAGNISTAVEQAGSSKAEPFDASIEPMGGNTLFYPIPRTSPSADGLPPASSPTVDPSAPTSPSEDLTNLYNSLTTRVQARRHCALASSNSSTALDPAVAEKVDRGIERMEALPGDVELLGWVREEIFGRFERAVAPSQDEEPDGVGKEKEKAESNTFLAAYPYLLAGAMRLFRQRWSHPSLSLALFAYARSLSPLSYALGCTTPAYNELLRARWEGWGHLKGVGDGVEEMRAAGVDGDRETRGVVEGVRRDVVAGVVAGAGGRRERERTREGREELMEEEEEEGGIPGVSAEAARMIGRMEKMVNESLEEQGLAFSERHGRGQGRERGREKERGRRGHMGRRGMGQWGEEVEDGSDGGGRGWNAGEEEAILGGWSKSYEGEGSRAVSGERGRGRLDDWKSKAHRDDFDSPSLATTLPDSASSPRPPPVSGSSSTPSSGQGRQPGGWKGAATALGVMQHEDEPWQVPPLSADASSAGRNVFDGLDEIPQDQSDGLGFDGIWPGSGRPAGDGARQALPGFGGFAAPDGMRPLDNRKPAGMARMKGERCSDVEGWSGEDAEGALEEDEEEGDGVPRGMYWEKRQDH